tara:strand:+ start:470 stop:1072 length:603 start_codon:yes stop_codon:yes gene_type:complete
MISTKNINKAGPYKVFLSLLERAEKNKQESLEAISISTYNKEACEVESRFVNLKYVIDDEWIFFSNYNSSKAKSLTQHNQIAALLYWNKIDVQIRIKAKIAKTDEDFSNKYFSTRSLDKNTLAIFSNQSQEIGSYEEVISKYNKLDQSEVDKTIRPDYWGGYSFIPYYFEFWEGHKSRINKRQAFIKDSSGIWQDKYLQP